MWEVVDEYNWAYSRAGAAAGEIGALLVAET